MRYRGLGDVYRDRVREASSARIASAGETASKEATRRQCGHGRAHAASPKGSARERDASGGTRAAARDSRHTRQKACKPQPCVCGSSNTSRHIEHRRCAGGGEEGGEEGGGEGGGEGAGAVAMDGGGMGAERRLSGRGRRCRNFLRTYDILTHLHQRILLRFL